MTCLRLVFCLVLALGAGGCSCSDSALQTTDTGAPDSGLDVGSDSGAWSGDAGPRDSSNQSWDAASDGGLQVLVLERPTGDVSLVPGEVLSLAARVTDELGRPVPGARVDFALLGTQLDSSLSQLFAFADVDGRVTAYVFGGLYATTFQLRLTTDLANPVYLRIEVTSPPTSPVALAVAPLALPTIAHVGVVAFANATCADTTTLPPSQGTDFVAADGGSLTLATGVTYALLAIGTDPVTSTDYTQCIDGVDPLSTTPVTFDFGLGGP